MRGNTKVAIEAMKTFLSTATPISKRAAMYRLLSMGLLDSTKKFAKFEESINTQLARRALTDEHFNDDCFCDNGRRTDLRGAWRNLSAFLQTIRGAYRRDFWQNQPSRVEVWLEKETASFLVQDVTQNLGVPLQISAGHYSRTFLHEIARTISSTNVPIQIFYIGDFDPGGIDIEETAQRARKHANKGSEGLADFLENEFGWERGRFEDQITWTRIGVTEAEYRSIPVNARVALKKGDTKTAAFEDRYGNYGVEVEALEVIEQGGLSRRLDAAIRACIDLPKWEASKRTAAREHKALAKIASARKS